MDLRNTNPQKINNNKLDCEIQITDWHEYNEDFADSDSEEETFNKKYIIRIFGVDKDNNSVSLKVKDFKPRFYLHIPNNFNTSKIKILLNEIKNKVKKRYKESLNKFLVVKKKMIVAISDILADISGFGMFGIFIFRFGFAHVG